MSEHPMYEGTPFCEPLVDIDPPTGGNIVTLPSHPDVIIRNPSVWFSPELYISAKGLFEELETSYGIHIPRFQYVIGAGKYRKQVFVVTERIYGRDIESLEPDAIPSKSESEELCNNLVSYFQNVYRQRKIFLSDLSRNQFMYGHRQGETKDAIFMVDLDPVFEQYDPHSIHSDFFLSIQDVFSMIKRLEVNLDEKLSVSRQNLRDFLCEVSGVHRERQYSVNFLLKRLDQNIVVSNTGSQMA